MTVRFPNPIPSGTRVPQWALLDVTVRCYVLFDGNVLTVPSSLRTTGIPISRMPSVVGILSLFFTCQRLNFFSQTLLS
jgi:hypothetical protein